MKFLCDGCSKILTKEAVILISPNNNKLSEGFICSECLKESLTEE